MPEGGKKDEGRGGKERGEEEWRDGSLEASCQFPVQPAKGQNDEGKRTVPQLPPDGTLGNRPW